MTSPLLKLHNHWIATTAWHHARRTPEAFPRKRLAAPDRALSAYSASLTRHSDRENGGDV
jgi:hypothetical protein